MREFVERAKSEHCELVCLPECFDWMKKGTPGQPITLAEREWLVNSFQAQRSTALDGPLFTQYRALARDHKVAISFGGFHEKANDSGTRLRNTHVLVDQAGEIAASYSKMHLFDVDILGLTLSSMSSALITV